MEIVVDSSVASNAICGTEGYLYSLRCLRVIKSNNSYTIIYCPEWTEDWMAALSIPCTKSGLETIRSFLLEWQTSMLARSQVTSSSHPVKKLIESVYEGPLHKQRPYIIALALHTGCPVLYCSLDAPECSTIEHPAIASIEWKKSELAETVAWLLANA